MHVDMQCHDPYDDHTPLQASGSSGGSSLQSSSPRQSPGRGDEQVTGIVARLLREEEVLRREAPGLQGPGNMGEKEVMILLQQRKIAALDEANNRLVGGDIFILILVFIFIFITIFILIITITDSSSPSPPDPRAVQAWGEGDHRRTVCQEDKYPGKAQLIYSLPPTPSLFSLSPSSTSFCYFHFKDWVRDFPVSLAGQSSLNLEKACFTFLLFKISFLIVQFQETPKTVDELLDSFNDTRV